MPFETFAEATDAVVDIADRFTLARTAIRTLLAQGTQTRRDVLGLRAAIGGIRGDIRTFRASVDPIDSATLLDQVDGPRVIGAWRWERQTRRGLALATTGLLKLDTRCGELLEGLERRVVVTRKGDTWQTLAARELGDWRAWRRLLEANDMVGVNGLVPGLTLTIPQ